MAELSRMAALDTRPNNLPLQTTRLLGRESDLQAVRGLILREDVRLVTMTGPGGSGKTRLGLQAAMELLGQFEDGAFFVDLSPIADPDLVVSTIVRTFGIFDAGGRSLLDVLVNFLRRRRILLLLDNFEQILAAAVAVADLLKLCPSLSVLVTSRAPLQIDGEHEFVVLPLALPDPLHQRTPELLSQYPAVALFVERAVAIRSDFSLTNANAPAVAEICVRLDGLPLAIELAAARTRLLSPEAILSRLGHGLSLLTGGRRDVPARQQTLRNTITWSYDLLDPAEQALCRRLGVFVGGFTLEAAEAVCNVNSTLGVDLLDSVGSLVEQSLVRAEGADKPRFGMLEMIHEYALERLDQSGEEARLRRRHAEYFAALAEQAEPHILRADANSWLNRLQAEHDNLRAALNWCFTNKGDTEIGVRIATALSRFWQVRSYLSEGQRWLELALISSADAPVAARLKALIGAGWLAQNRGDLQRARTLFTEAVDLSRQLGDRQGIADATGNLGLLIEQLGHYEQAAALLAESLALYRETGDAESVAIRLRGLGSVACAQGDVEQATVLLEECLVLSRRFGGPFTTALALGSLGLAVLYQRDHERALKLFEESLELFRGLEHTYGVAWSLHYLGRVALLRGDLGRATTLLVESLILRQELEDQSGIAQCLEGIAAVGLARRQLEQAVRLLGAAASLREVINAPLSPAERLTSEQALVAGHMGLSENIFAAIWADGWALPLDRAIECALELAQLAASDSQATSDYRVDASRMSSLTPREYDVAALIARGLTNRQIASELIIAERTVDTHVHNILGKLSLTSRTQVAAWGVRQGLVPQLEF